MSASQPDSQPATISLGALSAEGKEDRAEAAAQ